MALRALLVLDQPLKAKLRAPKVIRATASQVFPLCRSELPRALIFSYQALATSATSLPSAWRMQ